MKNQPLTIHEIFNLKQNQTFECNGNPWIILKIYEGNGQFGKPNVFIEMTPVNQE